jgi:uncharacterized protein
MNRQIFVNLPVRSLDRSVAFFTNLGFSFDPKFSDEKAACMVIGDNIFAMLLVDVFFSTFTRKEVCDANKQTEVLVCISCESRSQVDEIVVKAMAAGGTVPRPPEDHGFMYGHGFEDPDGHIWELVWMNTEMATPAAPA